MRLQNAAPKSKYIEHILTATFSDAGVAEIFRVLQLRLRDSTWTIVFKALIVVHMMIREGAPDAALRYMSQNPQRLLAITSITDGQFSCYDCIGGMMLTDLRLNSSDPRCQHLEVL